MFCSFLWGCVVCFCYLLFLACLYQLSFSWVTGSFESNVTDAAINKYDSVLLANPNEEIVFKNDINEEKLIIAYEPIWAIGTGETAGPSDAQSIHARIREKVSSLSDTLGDNLRILYGGSVSGDNCGSFLKEEDIDGVLDGDGCPDPTEVTLVFVDQFGEKIVGLPWKATDATSAAPANDTTK